MGALGIWQGLGHPIWHSVYWVVALLGFLGAAFRTWLIEVKKSECIQQPDVALVWNWSEDQSNAKDLFGLSETDKSILVHNRSGQYIYNVQIEPIVLRQTLTFDTINEIAPGTQNLALGRWDNQSSLQTNYVHFFGNNANEQEASNKGWVHKKLHNRGLSDLFLKVPMAIQYQSGRTTWRCEFDFDYDIGDDSLFCRRSGQRIH